MSYGYSHAGGYAASRHSPLPQQLKSAQEAGCAHPARVRGDLQVGPIRSLLGRWLAPSA